MVFQLAHLHLLNIMYSAVLKEIMNHSRGKLFGKKYCDFKLNTNSADLIARQCCQHKYWTLGSHFYQFSVTFDWLLSLSKQQLPWNILWIDCLLIVGNADDFSLKMKTTDLWNICRICLKKLIRTEAISINDSIRFDLTNEAKEIQTDMDQVHILDIILLVAPNITVNYSDYVLINDWFVCVVYIERNLDQSLF